MKTLEDELNWAKELIRRKLQDGFWGVLSFRCREGHLVLCDVSETLKPETELSNGEIHDGQELQHQHEKARNS